MSLDLHSATRTAGSARGILAVHVREQLPRQLQEKFIVSIEGDPFGLRAKAVFRKHDPKEPTLGITKTYETPLLTTVVEGKVQFAAIPDEFLSLLCLIE